MPGWTIFWAFLFCMIAGPLMALTLEGDARQGGMMIGKTEPGATVSLDQRAVRVTPDGGFLIGFGRDHGSNVRLTITLPNGAVNSHDIAVAQRVYQEQRIDGLPPKSVTPDPSVLERIRGDSARVRAARAIDSPIENWTNGFTWPADGRITGVYGSRRILNGQPRAPHYGVDIAAPKGTSVHAPAAGIVRLAEDLYYSGLTMIIDHGHGLSSTYLHLDRMDVRVGDTVTAGAVIGVVGSTGRSTGPHLDWRFNWFDQRLDPELVAGPLN